MNTHTHTHTHTHCIGRLSGILIHNSRKSTTASFHPLDLPTDLPQLHYGGHKELCLSGEFLQLLYTYTWFIEKCVVV